MILEAIAGMFIDKGLNLLAGTVEAGGEEAVKYIEKKTGLDIKDIANPETDTVLTSEHVEKLESLEIDKVLDLAKIVAAADANKAGGIVLAAIAPEIPELILFGMGLMVIGFFILAGQHDTAKILSATWFGALAMYVKGK